jgi:hypothetical protein
MLRAVLTFKDLALFGGLASVCLAFLACDSPVEPDSEGRQIEVRYLSAMTAEQQGMVEAAVDKWTRAVSKDLGDFHLNSPADDCFPGKPALNEIHHNLLVFISIAEDDGPQGQLAFTEICAISSLDRLPMLSHVRLDRADVDSMEARGILAAVITHELGHALGFNPASYVPMGLAGGGTNDPYFSGATARSEFAQHGAWYSGATVPLESATGQGPDDPHWRFSVFGDELMVSAIGRYFKSPLSVITLGLFQDLGYDVDFSVADPYEVAPLFGANRVFPEASLANDFRIIARPTIVAPLPSH